MSGGGLHSHNPGLCRPPTRVRRAPDKVVAPPWTEAERDLFRLMRSGDAPLTVGEAAEELGRTIQDCATEFELGNRDNVTEAERARSSQARRS